MKTTSKILFFVLGSLLVQAQENTHRRFWIGVNAFPSFAKTAEYPLSPRVGYWVNKKLLLGVEGRFDLNRTSSLTSSAMGVFGRYYVGNGKVTFFPHLSLNHETFKKRDAGLSMSGLVTHPGVGVRFGRLNKRFGVELLLEKPLALQSKVADFGNLQNQFRFTIGLSFSF
ncbi:hypothetical protein P1X15_12870 [Runella sp. MFBS21]|uniref:hypothetical protein n=1 Tax=Runella sp. MFBS21 TaxID=3034018 RepID=UPI0023F7C893|nr:hypothetical protein [Runella sp. MFBS21]MDF7818499.1 hypothetical protein [Runella sp. MFBS21]